MRDTERKGGLQWEADQEFTEGRVIGQVQRADGARGRLYSVRFGRDNPRFPNALTPYLEARDLPALRLVLDQVDDYLREQKTDQLRERFPSSARR